MAAFPQSPLLDCLADGIIATDLGEGGGYRIVYVNPAACAITGYAPEELIGRDPKLLQGPDTDAQVMRRLRKDLDARLPFNGQTTNYRKDGTPFVMEWSVSTLDGPGGEPEFHVAVQRAATLPARRLLEAEHEARTDRLTGLPNRAHMDDILADGGWLTTRARSAVVVDLDHFKAVNDTYGHLVGDEVLQLVAARLTTTVDSGDLVARWGGEEFCILTLGDGEQVGALARRIVQAIAERPFPTSVGELALTASAGCASRGEHRSAPRLLAAADQAMYAAKQGGRNRAAEA